MQISRETYDMLESNDIQVRDDYSGRNMYGKPGCFAIVGSLRDFMLAFNMIAEESECDMWMMGDSVEQDSMGKSSIWYFPDVTVAA